MTEPVVEYLDMPQLVQRVRRLEEELRIEKDKNQRMIDAASQLLHDWGTAWCGAGKEAFYRQMRALGIPIKPQTKYTLTFTVQVSDMMLEAAFPGLDVEVDGNGRLPAGVENILRQRFEKAAWDFFHVDSTHPDQTEQVYVELEDVETEPWVGG